MLTLLSTWNIFFPQSILQTFREYVPVTFSIVELLCDLSMTYLGNTGLGAESHSKGKIILSIAWEGYNQRGLACLRGNLGPCRKYLTYKGGYEPVVWGKHSRPYYVCKKMQEWESEKQSLSSWGVYMRV